MSMYVSFKIATTSKIIQVNQKTESGKCLSECKNGNRAWIKERDGEFIDVDGIIGLQCQWKLDSIGTSQWEVYLTDP